MMNSADIEERNASMNTDLEFKNAKDVRGIKQFHHLQVVNEKVVGYATTQKGLNY